MKRNLSDYIVALSVIACSVMLLLALTFALSGYHFQKAGRTLQIDYQDVTGIKMHSEVRYAGAPAGRVIAIRHLSPDERVAAVNKKNAVRLTLSIDPTIPPLPTDVVASLSSDTLLGQKFIALSAGTPGIGTLANDAVIEGHPAYGIEELAQAAGPMLDDAKGLFDHANSVLSNVDKMLTKVDGDLGETMPKISALTDVLQGVSKDATALIGRATKLITDNEGDIKKDLLALQTVVSDLQGVLKNADGMLGRTDKQIEEQMKALHVVLLNLKVATTYSKALTQDLGEKPNRLIFSGKPNKLTPEAEILKSDQPLPAKEQ